MPILILIGTISLVLAILLRRWFITASKEDKRALVILSVWTLSSLGLLVLILTGRFFHALGWALMCLLLLLISGTIAKHRKAREGDIEILPPQAIDGMTIPQAYKILGLQKNASRDDIQEAYIALIQQVKDDAVRSAKITLAYDILMDPKRPQ
jgi:preprotein translocase subunit Sec63